MNSATPFRKFKRDTAMQTRAHKAHRRDSLPRGLSPQRPNPNGGWQHITVKSVWKASTPRLRPMLYLWLAALSKRNDLPYLSLNILSSKNGVNKTRYPLMLLRRKKNGQICKQLSTGWYIISIQWMLTIYCYYCLSWELIMKSYVPPPNVMLLAIKLKTGITSCEL